MDSLIGATTRVDGNLLFRGGMRIDGQVVGVGLERRTPATW